MNKKDGFSIIELMTVLFIIALMALAALALFMHFRESTRLKTATREVASVLRLARQEAVNRRVRILVAFDLSGTSAGGQDAIRDEVWLEEETMFNRADWTRMTTPHSKKIMDKGVDITDVTNNFGTEADNPGLYFIAFFPEGRARGATTRAGITGTDAGTSVHITTKKVTDTGTLEDSAHRKEWYTVTVIANTGRVKIYDYGKNAPFPD